MEKTKQPTPRFKKPEKLTHQSSEDTMRADVFTQMIYDTFETNKLSLIQVIQTFLHENGEKFINMRDSTGNCLIHNLCMGLSNTDEDAEILVQVLLYLLKSAKIDLDELQVLAVQNFLKGLPLSVEEKQAALIDLGIVDSPESFMQIIKVNPGNAFGQTTLHILAAQKKTKLLFKFLDTVYNFKSESPSDGDIAQEQKLITMSMIGFNPNQLETTNRTFMQILLEKGLIREFEQLLSQYGNLINVKGKDAFSNSTLMIYKEMKREQISDLCEKGLYSEMIKAIKDANLLAFKDLRNLLFDRELGTNILTEFLLRSEEAYKKLIAILAEIKKQLTQIIGEQIMENLANVPDKQGQSVLLKGTQFWNYSQIILFFETIDSKVSYFENKVTGQNLAHHILGNRVLASREKLLLLQNLNLSNYINKIDNSGNLPLNNLLQSLNQFDQNDAEVLEFVCQNTDLLPFQTVEYSEDLIKSYQGQIQNLIKLRKQMADFKEKRLGSLTEDDVEGEQDFREFKQWKFRSKLKTQQKLLNQYNEPLVKQQIPKNPLEVAIKIRNTQIAKILISNYKLTPLAMSSNFQITLLELSSQQDDPTMFETIIDSLQVSQGMHLYKPVQTLINMFQQISEAGGNSQGKLKDIFEKLEAKLFADEQTLRTHLMSELGGSESAFVAQIVQKQDTLANISELILQAGYACHYLLAKKLMNIAIVDESLKNTIYFELFLNRLQRHDLESIKILTNVFSDFREVLLLNLTKDQKQKIIRAMLIDFNDIKNPETLMYLNKELNLSLVPVMNIETNNSLQQAPSANKKGVKSQAALKKLSYDRSFQMLSTPRQNELITQIHQNAFQYAMGEIMQGISKNISELNQVLDYYLNSKHKQQYLQLLIEKNAFFKILDVRREAQQETIGIFITQSLRSSNTMPIALQMLSQLKDYLKNQCSKYPADYHAEISQYERNYPYRDFKISHFIRKMNMIGDRYPGYMGHSNDDGEINDDQEEYLSMIWNEMLQQKEPLDSSKYPSYPHYSSYDQPRKDKLIPNGNAILFKIFGSMPPVSLPYVDSQNHHSIKKLLEFVVEFGGYPMVQISPANLHDQLLEYNDVKLLKNCQKFNQCIKQGNYQNLLHQFAYDLDLDKDLLNQLATREDSLQRENFNCKDKQGKTPLALAIEFENFTFIDAICQDGKVSCIYLDDNLISIMQKTFQTASLDNRIRLLLFLGRNIRELTVEQKKAMQNSCKKTVSDFIDLIFSTQLKNKDEKFSLPSHADDIFKILQTTPEIFHTFNNQLMSVFKLRKKQISAKSSLEVDQLIGQRLLTPQFSLGRMLTKLGADPKLTLESVIDLEKVGFDICNFVAPAFNFNRQIKQASSIVPYFPMKDDQFYYSYLLKGVLLNQPKNEQLIDHIISKSIFKSSQAQISEEWKPFSFEIMILIGDALGTENSHFQRLIGLKVYLMGKHLTNVESRLKFFSDSLAPLYSKLYYTQEAYENMLVQFYGLLIKNNRYDDFCTVLDEQSKFYLKGKFLGKSIELCCRYVKPRFALVLFSHINDDMEYKFTDQANLLPDLTSVVTLRDIRENSQIVRALEGTFNPKLLYKKLSRDLLDEYIRLVIENNTLTSFFTFEDKEKAYDQKQFFSDLYLKLSPKYIVPYVEALLSLCKLEHECLRVVKMLLSIQFCQEGGQKFSAMHKSKRRTEIKNYMFGKIDKWAIEDTYYEIMADEERLKELSVIIGLDEKDLKELRTQIVAIRDDKQDIDSKEFVYSELQSIVGAFKGKHGGKAGESKQTTAVAARPAVNRLKAHSGGIKSQVQKPAGVKSSIKEMQETSVQEVKAMTRDEIKTKSENLVLLWEFLQRDEKRRSGATFARDNRNTNVISDLEIRKLMQTQKPQQLNLDTVFQCQDIAIFPNDIEQMVQQFKFLAIQDTLVSLIESSGEQKYLSMAEKLIYGKSLPITISLYISFLQKYKENVYPLLKEIPFIPKDDNQDDDDWAHDDEDIDTGETIIKIRKLISSRCHLFEYVRDCLDQQQANDYVTMQGMSALLEFLDYRDFTLLFSLQFRFSKYQQEQLFQEPLFNVFTIPSVYEEVKESFFQPLVENMEDIITSLEDNPNSMIRFQFLYSFICIPIFKNALNESDKITFELRKRILGSEIIMSNMPNCMKSLIFIIMASQPTCTHLTDTLLCMMRKYMLELDTLSLARDNQFTQRNANKINFKPFAGGQEFDSKIVYLARCKRFKVVREYIEDIDNLSKAKLIAIIQNINASDPEHVDLLRWAIQQSNLDFSEHLDFLELIIMDANAISLLKVLDDIIGKGILIDNYIQFMKNQDIQNALNDEEENVIARTAGTTKSLLHELIKLGQPKVIFALRELANKEQWDYLSSYKSYVMDADAKIEDSDEDAKDDEEEKESSGRGELIDENEERKAAAEAEKGDKKDKDLARPFFFALSLSNFEMAKEFMISKEDIESTLSKAEYRILESTIKSTSILSFKRGFNSSQSEQLIKFNEITYQYVASSSNNFVFKLAKLIIQFPEILLFIHFAPAKYGINLGKIAQNLVQSDLSDCLEVNLFYLRCGFAIKEKGLFDGAYEEKALFAIQNIFKKEHFEKPERAILKQLLDKPYNQLQGFFKRKVKYQTPDVFISTQLSQVLAHFKDKIQQQERELYDSFVNAIEYRLNLPIGNRQFALAIYIVNLISTLDYVPSGGIDKFSLLQETMFNVKFDTLAQDLAYIQLIEKVCKQQGREALCLQISAAVKEPNVFYIQDRPFAKPGNPRFIALLLALYNSSFIKGNKIAIKKEGVDQTFINTLKFTLEHQTEQLKKEEKKISEHLEYQHLGRLLSLVQEGLDLYSQTFQSNQLETLSKQLGLELQDDFLPINMTNHTQVKDNEVFALLLELANFDGKTYTNQFEFNIKLSELESQLKSNDSQLYPKTRSLIQFLNFDVNGIIETFAHLYNAKANPSVTIFGVQKGDLQLKFNLTIGGPKSPTQIEEDLSSMILKISCWVSGKQESAEQEISDIIIQVLKIVNEHHAQVQQSKDEVQAKEDKAKEQQRKPKVVIKSKYDEDDQPQDGAGEAKE